MYSDNMSLTLNYDSPTGIQLINYSYKNKNKTLQNIILKYIFFFTFFSVLSKIFVYN